MKNLKLYEQFEIGDDDVSDDQILKKMEQNKEIDKLAEQEFRSLKDLLAKESKRDADIAELWFGIGFRRGYKKNKIKN